MVDELRVGTTWADVTPPGAFLKNIEVSSGSLNVTEGGTNSFQVRLSSQPDASVTVNVSRVSGSTNLVVLPGSASAVFASTNWSAYQSIYIEALTDSDTNNETATITCTDPGSTYSPVSVSATQIDTTVPSAVPPSAVFSATPTIGYAPLLVAFTDTSTGTITNRYWDFGDGVTSNTTGTNVTHTYTVGGATSTVQLIVSGPLGASTNAQVDLIRVLPGTPSSLPLYNSFSDSVSTSAIPAGWFCIAPGSNTAHSSITSGSLSFTGLQASAGNSWGLAQKLDDYSQDFAASNLAVGETVYFSFLMRLNSPLDPFSSGYFRLYDSADLYGSGVNIGWGTSATNNFTNTTTMGFAVNNRSSGSWSTASLKTPETYTAADTVYLLVGSYTRGSASTNGSVRLWVNPDSATFGTATPPPATLATNSYASDAVWNRLEFISNGAVAGVPSWQVDEVRIATSWAGVVPSVDGIPDSNGDGIPDSWSTVHFGGPTNANASALAANGINTILEAYIAGLNPTNAQSVLALSLQQGSSQSLLQWSAVSGRVYSVYWTTNLISGFQSLETNIVWPQNSWTGQVSGSRADFYKIKVQMAP
jgi:PKD repeat protein